MTRIQTRPNAATRRAAVAVLLMSTLTGCDILEPGPVEPITELPRALSVQEEALIEAGNRFGLELAREVAARDDRANVFLSPLSASMALGMTLNGANGATFEGMRDALGFEGLSQSEINDAYSSLIELLTTLDPSVRFDIANSIWANQDVPIHESFIETVRAAFDARSESRDFSDPNTVDEINDWVDENTNGLIEEIIDSIDPGLVMLLINAIYFEGTWALEFDEDETRSQTFTREDGSAVDVEMMSMSDAEVGVGYGSDYSALELTYGGEAFSMVVVLPDWNVPVRDFLSTVDEEKWEEIVASFETRQMDLVSIPKLRLEYDAFLNDALREMGMDPAFRPGADFTGMSPLGNSICIDFVRQKTYLEVDERGTRAAAVTAVGVRVVSFNGFVADRPFLVAIRERLSGTVIFFGLVGDPTFEDSGPGTLESTCR